jgi:hypothetical protein
MGTPKLTTKPLNHTKPVQSRPKWFLPLMVIGFSAAVIGGVLGLIVANQQPPYIPEVTGRAAVAVDQDYFDYGDVHYNNPVETIFRVKNVGDEVLYLAGAPLVEVVEGCCPPQTTVSSKTLYPGQSTTVAMRFSMHEGMDGPHEFRVHVRTTDPVVPDKEVTVLSNWIP